MTPNIPEIVNLVRKRFPVPDDVAAEAVKAGSSATTEKEVIDAIERVFAGHLRKC